VESGGSAISPVNADIYASASLAVYKPAQPKFEFTGTETCGIQGFSSEYRILFADS